MRGNFNRPELRGRRRERETLDRLLRDVRAGHSRVLVLRGEAGVGKTALLDYLTGTSAAVRVARAAGVEPETEIAYSALQQLCAPLLGHLDAAARAAARTRSPPGSGSAPVIRRRRCSSGSPCSACSPRPRRSGRWSASWTTCSGWTGCPR